MSYNSAQRKDIRRAEKDERSSEQETKTVLQALTSSGAGRRWLWNTLSECHIFSTTFLGDVNQMLFAEGERNQGLKLLADITRYCPDTFTLMMQEAQERDGRSTPNAGTDGSGEPDSDAAHNAAYRDHFGVDDPYYAARDN